MTRIAGSRPSSSPRAGCSSGSRPTAASSAGARRPARAARRRCAPPSTSSPSCSSAADALRIEDHWQVHDQGVLLPRRPHPGQRGLRPGPGTVGHRRQALRRAGAPAARRPVRDRIRVYGWVGGDEPTEVADQISAQLEVGPDRRQDERQRPDEPARLRGRARRRGPPRRRRPRGPRRPPRRRGRLPRPVQPGQRPPGRAAAGAVPAVLPRGAGRARRTRTCSASSSARPPRRSPPASGSTAGRSSCPCCRPASPSPNRTSPTPAASPRCARSPRWPRSYDVQLAPHCPLGPARARRLPAGRLRDARTS